MPALDVTEILEDPDFADVFTVIRRFEAVSATGRSVVLPRRYDGILGTILAADPSTIKRDDDSAMTARNIKLVTRFRLRPQSVGIQADQIVYNGSVYTIKSAKLWTRFGAGFIKAEAESGNASDPIPT